MSQKETTDGYFKVTTPQIKDGDKAYVTGSNRPNFPNGWYTLHETYYGSKAEPDDE